MAAMCSMALLMSARTIRRPYGTSCVQLIGAHRRKLALGVHRDRRYTEAGGNHRRDREQAHPRRHLALLMVGSQSKGVSFENGTAFSAVAPSWRLAGSRLSIVLPITRPSQDSFHGDM
jgi:hypothetical protein